MDVQTEIGAHAQPGAVLLGKYRVERLLGAGGMGAVVAARHLQLDERVAIKFLLGSVAGNAVVVERFLREARAAIKIRSEHCVRVLDVGTLEGGAPYMVMEYLEGDDLETLVDRAGPLPISDAVDFVMQAAEALAEAHVIGIVHRDLKPANLFVARRADGSPLVKVLDFGISKQKSTQGEMGMTSTQNVFGSPRYMSPEQMRSTRDVDARTDVWSLTTVLHELLSGVPPFDAETMPELCAKILQDAPAPLATRRRDVPPGLDAAILRGLEKDRDRRWRNMAEFGAAVAPFGTASAHASAARIARVLGAPLPMAPPPAAPLPFAQPMHALPAVATSPRAGGSTTSAAASSMNAAPPTSSSGVGARFVLAAVGSFLFAGAVGVTGWAVVSHSRHSAPAASASFASTAASQALATAEPAATAPAPPSATAAASGTASTSATTTASVPQAAVAANPRAGGGSAPRGKAGAAQPPAPPGPAPQPVTPPATKNPTAPAPAADPFAERKDSF